MSARKEDTMGSFVNLLKVLAWRLTRRRELKLAVTFVLVIAALGFGETCFAFYGADVGEVPSAAYGWAWNMDRMQVQSMRTLAFLLMLLVAASVFSDSLYLDVKSGAASSIVTRSTKTAYVLSGALLSFVGGFFVLLVPLVLLQVFAFAAFPIDGSFSGNIGVPAYADDGQVVLFAAQVEAHPYLMNLAFAFYAAFWAGVMSVVSFSLSLFVRKSRLVILGAPTLVVLLCWQVIGPLMGGSDSLTHFYYLYPNAAMPGLSELYFFTAPLIVLTVAAVALAIAVRTNKDFLL